MRKRLVFAVTNDLSHDQRMIRICHTLAGRNYDVLLVGRTKRTSEALPPQTFRQHRLSCFFQRGKLFYLEYQMRLLLFLLPRTFDAICAIDLDTILPCLFYARLRRKICIYDAHEYYTESREIVGRPSIQSFWQSVGNYAVPRVDHHYTVGPRLAEILSAKYGSPFAVIRNVPVQRALPESLPPLDRPILLYQGILNMGRGLQQAIDLIHELKSVELWLVGEGDLSAELRAQVQRLELQDRVKFWGMVSPDALPVITQRATIGLNLLENQGLSYYYSLANKSFDYIQAALPSIQMSFPEYQAINEQFGVFHLVPDLEHATLLAAARKLLEDPTYYNQLVEGCLWARKELHWEVEEMELVALYDRWLV